MELINLAESLNKLNNEVDFLMKLEFFRIG